MEYVGKRRYLLAYENSIRHLTAYPSLGFKRHMTSLQVARGSIGPVNLGHFSRARFFELLWPFKCALLTYTSLFFA